MSGVCASSSNQRVRAAIGANFDNAGAGEFNHTWTRVVELEGTEKT
jgi:hypothetical protein